ncbi:MAG: polyphosphate kinase 1 [Pseudomonadota bacterium]|jgi:polyphosphate kinase
MNTPRIKGVSRASRALLAEHGIFSIQELADTDVDRLSRIAGLPRQKAERMIRAAKFMAGDMVTARQGAGQGSGQLLDNTDHSAFIDRELSLLEFNRRVLAQAQDGVTPLLERLNFLCISCSNLDEFFEVRVAGLLQRVELGGQGVVYASEGNPQEVLQAICRRSHDLVAEQYQTLKDVILPQLAQENIRFLRRSLWTVEQRHWLHDYFREEILPILSPIALDPAHPFPRILNKSLNFIISLNGKDAFGRDMHLAILQAPRVLPRIIHLPSRDTGSGPHDFVFLSSVIHAFVEELFHGMTIEGCYQFRVTRNSDLFLDEEEIDDLLRAVQGELAQRNYGDEVRLEVADNCPQELRTFLLSQFGLSEDRLYLVDGPVNLGRMREIYDLVDRPELKYAPFTPGWPEVLAPGENYFEAIRQGDILLHHPYQSFMPVIELLRQAALDNQVVSIKQTLYRTGPNSEIVDALVRAARAGKEVTVVIELRARFDEQANISLAQRLQQAGVQVVYGIVGYKTHAKMLLILRREGRRLEHFTHIGTGNYHPRTARIYSDYSFFTASHAIGDDVRRLFVQLTSMGRIGELSRLLQSPFTLHPALMDRLEREAAHVRAGGQGRVIIKVNSLVEPQLIEALYRASQAGVRISLIVRGICCLRPGVPGLSDHIEVRSVVGRFLEHSRVYYFENAGDPLLYLASADFMARNMFRRVETCCPLENRQLLARVLADLECFLADDTQAWLLGADGRYRRAETRLGVCAQSIMLESLRKPVS